MSVRTRFAPSPTGFLHIGGARTALFSWLYARKHKGQFVLRIEDTDVERSTQESAVAIIDSLAWLGIDIDEGPFYQSQRLVRYQEVVEQLLAQGTAYRCYCSRERLEALRTQQIADKQKPRYDGLCRDKHPHGNNLASVIRFQNPREGIVEFDDLVHGHLVFNNYELDDLVLIRSDGVPTYNFAVVVDDLDMKITHVVRGDDHINNTPRQINIFLALGAQPPKYAHVPTILGQDGKRLSKRHGAVSVLQYRDEGYLPQALLNDLIRLGWSHGDDEIFTVELMIDWFDLSEVNKSAAIFNPEKLLWLNQHYLKTEPPELIAKQLSWHMQRLGIAINNGPPLTEVVKAQAERCKTLVEMAARSRYFYDDDIHYAEKAVKENLNQKALAPLKDIRDQLAALENWAPQAIHEIVVGVAEAHGLKLGKVAQPLRVAVTGDTISPPIDVTVSLIGKQRALQRIDKALSSYCSEYDHQ